MVTDIRIPDPEAWLWCAAWNELMGSAALHHALHGGAVVEGARKRPGCPDRRPPADERAILIPQGWRCCGRAQWWQRSAALVLDDLPAARPTLARAWRLRCGQVVALLEQDGFSDASGRLVAALEGGGDGSIRRCDDLDDHPVIAWSPRCDGPLAAPSTPLLGTFIAGLREAYGLGAQGVRRYLKDVPGIAGTISGGAIEKLFRQTGEG